MKIEVDTRITTIGTVLPNHLLHLNLKVEEDEIVCCGLAKEESSRLGDRLMLRVV